MTSPISWSRSARAVGERRGLLQQALDGAALALQHLDQVHAQLVDLLGLERLEQRLEAVEERGQVERRAGLVDRDGVARLQPARRPASAPSSSAR